MATQYGMIYLKNTPFGMKMASGKKEFCQKVTYKTRCCISISHQTQVLIVQNQLKVGQIILISMEIGQSLLQISKVELTL